MLRNLHFKDDKADYQKCFIELQRYGSVVYCKYLQVIVTITFTYGELNKALFKQSNLNMLLRLTQNN